MSPPEPALAAETTAGRSSEAVKDVRLDRPTRVRYGVLAFLCSLAMVLYLDRVCIGQAAVPVQRELGISKTEWGWVLAAFIVPYALFEVPTGRWGDRYGSRGVLTRIVLWWSAFTALTGAAMGLWMLVGVRFLFGAGEAGALPNAARVTCAGSPPRCARWPRGWWSPRWGSAVRWRRSSRPT